MGIVKWYGTELKLAVELGALATLEEACIMVENIAKDSIGKVSPPSPPGHAPAAPTGTLKGRITHTKPKVTSEGLVGQVGTNLEYARRLELGFIGVDSIGRKYAQAPRPYLRPALHKSEAAIKKLFRAK